MGYLKCVLVIKVPARTEYLRYLEYGWRVGSADVLEEVVQRRGGIAK